MTDAAPHLSSTSRLTVAVAGASGFVGAHLVRALLERTPHRIIALSRSARDDDADGRVVWRRCDLLDHDQTHLALRGADVGVYLVHSMLPRGRGAFGSFADFDLLAADNFARAARANGLGQLLYLGGLLPRDRSALSDHLRSRLEVERVLAASGVPTTALRAGIVLGAGGSSFRILMRLVERLPVMFVPRWTGVPCQPIAVEDVVDIMLGCLGRPELATGSHDIGGPDVLSYREMMAAVARALGLRRAMVPLPVLTPRLSAAWVSFIAQVPLQLVRPLVGSLSHPMVAGERRLQCALGVAGRRFEPALAEALAHELREREAGHDRERGGAARMHAPRRRHSAGALEPVRAVDRIAPPPELADARDVATAYLRWLDQHFWGHWLRVRQGDGEIYEIGVPSFDAPIFVFRRDPQRDGPDRALLHVIGGLLADAEGGALEFRTVVDAHGAPGLVLAQVHGYMPSLPRWLYRLTQVPMHREVMKRFAHAMLTHRASLLRAPACAVPEALLERIAEDTSEAEARAQRAARRSSAPRQAPGRAGQA